MAQSTLSRPNNSFAGRRVFLREGGARSIIIVSSLICCSRSPRPHFDFDFAFDSSSSTTRGIGVLTASQPPPHSHYNLPPAVCSAAQQVLQPQLSSSFLLHHSSSSPAVLPEKTTDSESTEPRRESQVCAEAAFRIYRHHPLRRTSNYTGETLHRNSFQPPTRIVSCFRCNEQIWSERTVQEAYQTGSDRIRQREPGAALNYSNQSGWSTIVCTTFRSY